MRVIQVPSSVLLRIAEGTERQLAFRDFLIVAMDQHEAFGRASGVRQALKIAETVEKADGTLTLEDADYAALKAAVESAKYNPAVARQVVAFFDAVAEAKETPRP